MWLGVKVALHLDTARSGEELAIHKGVEVLLCDRQLGPRSLHPPQRWVAPSSSPMLRLNFSRARDSA